MACRRRRAADRVGGAAGDRAHPARPRPDRHRGRHPVRPAGHPVRARRLARCAADLAHRRAQHAGTRTGAGRRGLRLARRGPRHLGIVWRHGADGRRHRRHAAGGARPGAAMAARAHRHGLRALYQRIAGRRIPAGRAHRAADLSAGERVLARQPGGMGRSAARLRARDPAQGTAPAGGGPARAPALVAGLGRSADLEARADHRQHHERVFLHQRLSARALGRGRPAGPI